MTSSKQATRRTFTATAAGFAVGAFAVARTSFAAQDATAVTDQATPVAGMPTGYVSTRSRTLESGDARNQVNDLVLSDFVPEVEALLGFKGYALGDVTDQPNQSLSIVVLEEASQAAGFDEIGAQFVSTLEESITTVGTVQWEGDLLISAGPDDATSTATPSATPLSGDSRSDGYIALRVHTSLPGTDPRDFVPLATSGFLPIITGLSGFKGYLWYPIDGGFVAISLFDSVASADESTEAAQDWAAEYLTEYTDGNPEIVNANVVYANLPILP